MDEQVLEYFYILRTESYIHAGCIAIWFHEYICTIIPEIKFIWFSPLSCTKVLFFLTRYMQAVLVGALLHQGYSSYPLNKNDCLSAEKFAIVVYNIVMFLTELLFTLRTWAVWRRSLKSGILLATFFLTFVIACFFLTRIWYPTITPSPIRVPKQVIPNECANIILSSSRLGEYVLVSLFHIINLSLVAIQAYQSFKERKSLDSFARLVYFDGILYYIYLIPFSVLNILIIFSLPPQYAELFTVLQGFLGSILACRMLLNLRAHYERKPVAHKTYLITTSDLRTGSSPLNLDTLIYSEEGDTSDEDFW